MAAATQYIAPDRLCVGLYVHLDIGWMEHPFTFSSFKIKSPGQLASLRALGLERIRYEPARSEAAPLTEAAPAASVAQEVTRALSEAQLAAIDAKRIRIERLNRQRQDIAECRKQFLSAARMLKQINRNVFAKPRQALDDTKRLVELMTDSMLSDKDIAVHLVTDKQGGEDVYLHALNVAVLALILGKELGLPREAMRILGTAALLHDIGTLELPEHILHRSHAPGTTEQSVLRQHVAHSLAIGKKMGLLREELQVIYQHHEYVDGSGYPKGTKGDGIATLAKVLSVANDYDNLCNRPNPADSLSPHEALSLMYGRHRARYEAGPLNVFIRCLGVYPPGSLVLLSNDVVGMVIAINASKPLRPVVLIYDPDVPKSDAVVLDLEQDPDFSVAQCLKLAQVPLKVLEYLSYRKRMTYYFSPTQSE
jgi:putative nucleotidyltransferase with HDIG domain